MSAKSTTLPPRSDTLARPQSERILTVEFWRFAFTVLVCLYHAEIFSIAEIHAVRLQRG